MGEKEEGRKRIDKIHIKGEAHYLKFSQGDECLFFMSRDGKRFISLLFHSLHFQYDFARFFFLENDAVVTMEVNIATSCFAG
jgi:hypothetical protein